MDENNYLKVDIKEGQMIQFMKKLSPYEKTEFMVWCQIFNLVSGGQYEDACKMLKLSKVSDEASNFYKLQVVKKFLQDHLGMIPVG